MTEHLLLVATPVVTGYMSVCMRSVARSLRLYNDTLMWYAEYTRRSRFWTFCAYSNINYLFVIGKMSNTHFHTVFFYFCSLTKPFNYTKIAGRFCLKKKTVHKLACIWYVCTTKKKKKRKTLFTHIFTFASIVLDSFSANFYLHKIYRHTAKSQRHRLSYLNNPCCYSNQL